MRRVILLAVLGAVVCVPQASAATPLFKINSAISEYLGHLIDKPSAAGDAALAARANSRLTAAARGTSKACRRTVRRTQAVVRNLRLKASTKRKRILDVSARVYYEC